MIINYWLNNQKLKILNIIINYWLNNQKLKILNMKNYNKNMKCNNRYMN